MSHITTKLRNMGVLDHAGYRITMVLTRDHMVPHPFPTKKGKPRFHEIKPLKLIWDRFPQSYSPENTMHIDDLEENFIMNRSNGLQISPFKDAPSNKAKDRELWYVTQYLLLVREAPDVQQLDHRRWKDHIIQRLWESQCVLDMPPMVAPSQLATKTVTTTASAAATTAAAVAATTTTAAADTQAPTTTM